MKSPFAPTASLLLASAIVTAGGLTSACSTSRSAAAEKADASAPVAVSTVTPVTVPITRTIRLTGSLTADEQAEVSAEAVGRVIATPVERGSRVAAGALLVQLSTEQAGAQLAEAEANAARIAAGLNLADSQAFSVERVPDVANARAELELAQAEFGRIKSLLDQRVVSQSEFDQRQTRVEAARQRYESERNQAQQEYRAWEAARARVRLARKSVSDTAVRAPFAGLVGERLVSAGDFVTTGTRVATVVRVDPLRMMLTVPEQLVSQVKAGQSVGFTVDAYPDRTFTGTVRFISPAIRAEQRALTVEAVVPNPDGTLLPGLFVTARLEQPAQPALLLDKRAVRDVGKTSRVFAVVDGTTLEERIVTLGQEAGAQVEILSGVDANTVVALPGATPLTEGLRVQPTGAVATAASGSSR